MIKNHKLSELAEELNVSLKQFNLFQFLQLRMYGLESDIASTFSRFKIKKLALFLLPKHRKQFEGRQWWILGEATEAIASGPLVFRCPPF